LHEPTVDIQREKTLLTRCREGDDLAFRELYGRYCKAMFNICMRMLNDRVEAEDVLQEAFITTFGKLKDLKDELAFGSWLKRIVVNRCIDMVRKRKTWHVEVDESIPADDQQDEPATYDPAIVTKALAMLPEGYRVIVTLFLFEDLPHKEIAKKLGISESTSKSQYARGRRKLAALITELSHA
jgi:RNA polymerase sigma factor (sigma-70 family)